MVTTLDDVAQYSKRVRDKLQKIAENGHNDLVSTQCQEMANELQLGLDTLEQFRKEMIELTTRLKLIRDT